VPRRGIGLELLVLPSGARETGVHGLTPHSPRAERGGNKLLYRSVYYYKLNVIQKDLLKVEKQYYLNDRKLHFFTSFDFVPYSNCTAINALLKTWFGSSKSFSPYVFPNHQ